MQAEYRQRRQNLMEAMGSGAGIFRSAPMAVMHSDVEYNFRQESDFFYLTGFNEPNAVAVLAPHHEEHQFVLFVQPKDPLMETWTGYRVGVDLAKEEYGADAVYPIEELDEHLPQYLAGADRIYFHLGLDQPFNQTILKHWQRSLIKVRKDGFGPVALEDPMTVLHPQRLIKSETELDLMRKAIDISVEAHNLAREVAQPGRYEYEIQAEMERLFRLRGGLGPAYPSIVAAGVNGCILHYTENTCQLQEQDLLLIDAGCSYQYYNADITRTFPVSGTFTAEQKTLYELVLAAQEAAIAQVQPGNPYNAFHDAAVKVLTQGLVDLGLLKGEVDKLIEEEKYKPFYMHRTGHWLGLDVHDVGVYKKDKDTWQPLQAGHVVTVEPGIYIGPDIQLDEDQPEVPERWRGIGIRIEDDVLLTETGHEVLTAAVPKSIASLTH
ncbi:aminopeptidase P N-terminal domain-containing protein [Acaryochloris marina]|uniref:Xaa-Pro aminopeptidase n=1 Tax=Acaryochloris marina (strain MBIC 11017) TaxID=329726 RepID=B0C5Q7_ACAM1|nr:aminopeptidase P N-terminal domain-containing protein [Acaryochloris marina]ABW28778.1 Xaa-Pro aminopeptidase [Acaryochloris marina MBIC11017]BDM77765.1 Xaa-Pro aminopeptidase [Acaryochloris marina MBIC10699]